MPNPRKIIPKQRMKVERLQYESLINEKIFRNLYNQQVYFVDTDLKSKNYFKLGFSPEMIFTAGKNLIRIQGKPGMLAQNTPLLIEAVDRTGLPLKTSIYDLKNETSDKVICIEVHEATPAGDVRLTLAGTALRDPNGKPMPPAWQNEINFKWTQTFEARPFTANRSDILFNEETTPVITVSEVIKPWNKLTYNQELVTTMGGSTSQNIQARYRLQTGQNTRSKVSYRKSGGHYFITAHSAMNNILDFGGFTADMVGGILIVAEPISPRPRSVAGYDAPQIYSPKENGDGFKIVVPIQPPSGSSATQSSGACWNDETEDLFNEELYIQGAYQTTVLEFISPWEIRVKDPHTTWQGLKEETHRLFEHSTFEPSMYRLIWNQKPQSCDPTPLHSEPNGTGSMKNSFAHVKITNLTPASGDVTRIKSYTRNNQSPADWSLASDMTVKAKEMLYCEKETCTTPAGDFSKWGVGDEGILGVLPFWDAEGIGNFNASTLSDPALSLYYQQGADDSPPTPDSLVVGNNSGSTNLTGNNHWLLYSKLFPKFKKGKMYQLEISSLSNKTQATSWLPNTADVGDPSIEIYLSGSSFIDDLNDRYVYGKKVGSIKTSADKEKHVEQDRYNKDLTKGYKFLFVADEDGTGKPLIKINSGVWQFWNISLKPLDLFGFTPEEFEITFPTLKCDIKQSEAIDFKFEFYNDYGTISNYTAEINNITWENEQTAVFDNLIVNKLYADFLISTASVTNLQPVTYSAGIFVSGDTTIGTHCTQSLILNADVQLPCLNPSEGMIVTYNPNTDRLTYSSTQSNSVGVATASAIQNSFESVLLDDGQSVLAVGINDALDIKGDGALTSTKKVGGDVVISTTTTPTFGFPVTASLYSPSASMFSGSTSMSGKIDIGLCCTDDITIRGDIKLRCVDYWDNPNYVLSYDYPTRTVYYSDMPTGGGSGGGCNKAFAKIGYSTGDGISLFTASSCNDVFYLIPGSGINFATFATGVGNADDGLVISATGTPAWSHLYGDNGFGGNIITPGQPLYITGSGGIVTKAGYSSSGGVGHLVLEVDGSGISSGGGTCTASFGTIGVVTASGGHGDGGGGGGVAVFTASNCNDQILFNAGTNITLAHSTHSTADVITISAASTPATPGWKTLAAISDNVTTSTTTTTVGQTLTVVTAGGITASAAAASNGAKVTLSGGPQYNFHWGGRHMFTFSGSSTATDEAGEPQWGDAQQSGPGNHSSGVGYPLYTVPFYHGLSGTDANQSTNVYPGGMNSASLDRELRLWNCGWTVPHSGHVKHLRGWVSSLENKPVHGVLEVRRLKYAGLTGSCGDIAPQHHDEVFLEAPIIMNGAGYCRYELKRDLTTPFEVFAGDVLVPMWAFKPTSDGKRDSSYMMNLTIS